MTVRTRFAPSPTGYMHIGGMRTALFNWLFARHHGGKFILRIDDTDQQRNLDAALGPILDAFRWLGLKWDEGPEVGGEFGPYFQSQRGEFYRRAVAKLLESGAAYRDFESPEEIKQQREAAQAEKRTYLSSRVSLDRLTPAECAAKAAAGEPHVIRLLVDRTRKVSVADHVRGHVEWDCGIMPDPVICRSDGSPLYNFATVVDDVELQISHVIRAEEHLTNTAVQLLVYDALGVKPPEFAHIPFVAAPGTTKKLSKREIGKYRTNPQFRKLFDIADQILPAIGLQVSDAMNPVMVSFYEEVGFLPEAVLNALSRLGWSYDDKTENMPLAFVVENFSLERVVKGPAGLDPDKLLAYQEHWMGQVPLEEKVERCLPYLVRAKLVAEPVDDATRSFVGRLVAALGVRLKLFGDIVQYGEYFVADDGLAYDEKAFEKRLRSSPNSIVILERYRSQIASERTFDAESLKSQAHSLAISKYRISDRNTSDFALKSIDAFARGAELPPFSSMDAADIDRKTQRFAESLGLKLGDIIHSIRIAVTGKPTGPSLFDAMALLGRDRCLRRLDRAIQLAQVNSSSEIGTTATALRNVPPAMQSPFGDKITKQRIRLLNGRGTLLTNDHKIADGTATIDLDMQSDPQLQFGMSTGNIGVAPRLIGKCRLQIGRRFSSEALITNVSGISGRSKLRGILQREVHTGSSIGLRALYFHIANYHDLLGHPIRNDRQMWAGRSFGRFREWNVTIDELPVPKNKRTEARKTRRCQFTHVGELSKESGEVFDATEAHEVLDVLYHMLSFSRGFWVAPILMSGESGTGEVIWHDWSVWRTDPWLDVESWFPVNDRDAFGELLGGFAGFLTSVQNKEAIHTAIYWYLQANHIGRGLETSVIASMIALEATLDLFSSTDPSATSPELRTSHWFQATLEKVLDECQMPTEIPSEFAGLVELSAARGTHSAANVLRYVRNTVVHPTVFREESRFGSVEPFAVEYEATNLALWYVELILLKRLGFKRPYARRFGSNRWRGQTWPLPWARE